MVVNGCPICLVKQRRIDELKEEVKGLQAKLRYQERKEQDGYFGSSTPSSKRPVKPNSEHEEKKPKGARRLDMTPGATPSISARYLFNKLGLPRDGFRRCPVVWDNEHGGWLVHWKESIPVEDAIKPESIRVIKIPSDKKKKGKRSI